MVSNCQPYLLVWCLTIGHAFWCGTSLSAMSVGVVPHYRSCLLVWCLTIRHACWCGASLSDMPVGVVPHCRPCLLVWCLTKGHAFWCDTSLSAMYVGVVPQYRLCLLALYLNIGHACWFVATVQPIFYWSSADGRRMVTSLVPPVHRCLYIRYVCWFDANLTHACLYSATLSDMCARFIYSNTCICNASPSGKASGLLQTHQTCLQVRCRSPWFVNLSATILDAILNISNSEWCMNSNNWDFTRIMSVIQESVKVDFACKSLQFTGLKKDFLIFFCKKLPSWLPYCLHSYIIFIWSHA